jgi:hypothetical protein
MRDAADPVSNGSAALASRLVPVARVNLEDCQRMAAAFAQHHSNTRQAGQLYTAWRSGSAAIRKRLLDDPALFFKTQRPAEPKATVAPAVELSRPRDPHP